MPQRLRDAVREVQPGHLLVADLGVHPDDVAVFEFGDERQRVAEGRQHPVDLPERDDDDLDRALRPAVTLVSAWVSQLARQQRIDTTLLASRADLVGRSLDIYSPCALGGAIDDDTVSALSARVICGGANNQLAHPGVEKMLAERGIEVSCETIRCWANKFGPAIAANVRRARPRADSVRHLTRWW